MTDCVLLVCVVDRECPILHLQYRTSRKTEAKQEQHTADMNDVNQIHFP